MVDKQQGGSHRRRTLRIAGFVAAGLALVGAGLGGYAYWQLDGNIRGVDINGPLGTARPPAATDGSFNVLVLGSDTRTGANSKLAGGAANDTGRSDTAMVVHVNQSHTQAQVVSIPRDTLVYRPACTDGFGRPVSAARSAMYNSAFEVGGPVCSVKTAEQLTGLRMDHVVEFDFVGFASFIDAIGGVTVTTTVDIHDQDSGLDLPAGTHRLNGTQALAFVRTRHGVGDGSDLGRIELQKQMVKSIMNQIDGAGLLTDPLKLYTVADRLTRSITTDSDLASVNALRGLASTLKGIRADDLTMVTLPVVTASADLNRVVEQQPDADQVWAALRGDRPVPEAVVASQRPNPAQASPTASPSPSARSPRR